MDGKPKKPDEWAKIAAELLCKMGVAPAVCVVQDGHRFCLFGGMSVYLGEAEPNTTAHWFNPPEFRDTRDFAEYRAWLN